MNTTFFHPSMLVAPGGRRRGATMSDHDVRSVPDGSRQGMYDDFGMTADPQQLDSLSTHRQNASLMGDARQRGMVSYDESIRPLVHSFSQPTTPEGTSAFHASLLTQDLATGSGSSSDSAYSEVEHGGSRYVGSGFPQSYPGTTATQMDTQITGMPGAVGGSRPSGDTATGLETQHMADAQQTGHLWVPSLGQEETSAAGGSGPATPAAAYDPPSTADNMVRQAIPDPANSGGEGSASSRLARVLIGDMPTTATITTLEAAGGDHIFVGTPDTMNQPDVLALSEHAAARDQVADEDKDGSLWRQAHLPKAFAVLRFFDKSIDARTKNESNANSKEAQLDAYGWLTLLETAANGASHDFSGTFLPSSSPWSLLQQEHSAFSRGLEGDFLTIPSEAGTAASWEHSPASLDTSQSDGGSSFAISVRSYAQSSANSAGLSGPVRREHRRAASGKEFRSTPGYLSFSDSLRRRRNGRSQGPRASIDFIDVGQMQRWRHAELWQQSPASLDEFKLSSPMSPSGSARSPFTSPQLLAPCSPPDVYRPARPS